MTDFVPGNGRSSPSICCESSSMTAISGPYLDAHGRLYPRRLHHDAGANRLHPRVHVTDRLDRLVHLRDQLVLGHARPPLPPWASAARSFRSWSAAPDRWTCRPGRSCRRRARPPGTPSASCPSAARPTRPPGWADPAASSACRESTLRRSPAGSPCGNPRSRSAAGISTSESRSGEGVAIPDRESAAPSDRRSTAALS